MTAAAARSPRRVGVNSVSCRSELPGFTRSSGRSAAGVALGGQASRTCTSARRRVGFSTVSVEVAVSLSRTLAGSSRVICN